MPGVGGRPCPVAGGRRGRDRRRADEPALAAIVGIVRDSDVLGAIGRYRGVFELGFGLESFVPGADAVPTTGRAGVAEVVPCVTLESHAAIDADLTAVLAAIGDAHPWEAPVIEVGEVTLAGV